MDINSLVEKYTSDIEQHADYKKMIKVINSCRTLEHAKAAEVYIENFYEKHRDEPNYDMTLDNKATFDHDTALDYLFTHIKRQGIKGFKPSFFRKGSGGWERG